MLYRCPVPTCDNEQERESVSTGETVACTRHESAPLGVPFWMVGPDAGQIAVPMTPAPESKGELARHLTGETGQGGTRPEYYACLTPNGGQVHATRSDGSDNGYTTCSGGRVDRPTIGGDFTEIPHGLVCDHCQRIVQRRGGR